MHRARKEKFHSDDACREHLFKFIYCLIEYYDLLKINYEFEFLGLLNYFVL